MEWVSRMFDWLLGRDQGEERRRLQAPPPTPTTRLPERPAPTPTTRPMGGTRGTAGTPSYGAPGGTPSTQRLHNPTHLGR